MINIRRGSTRVHAGDDGSGRIALIGLFVVLSLIFAAVKLTAQESSGASRGAIRPYVGAYIPTGEQRDFLKDAVLVGAGVGSRTYSYRDLQVDSKTNFDGFGALGFDLGVGPIGVRIEGRDYVSRFQPLTGGGETKTRNDVALVAGLGVRF